MKVTEERIMEILVGNIGAEHNGYSISFRKFRKAAKAIKKLYEG